jgi:hypothetical protein
MGTRKSVKMMIAIPGLLGAALLTISSGNLMQAVLSAEVQIAQQQQKESSGQTAPVQLAKNIPAATQEAPEEIEAKKHPSPPGKPEDAGKPRTKEQMIQTCMKEPSCRQTFQEAQKGKRPAKVRPAATQPSPEEVEMQKYPSPPRDNHEGPHSERTFFSWSSLLAWFNPFHPEVAEADDFSVTVDTSRPQSAFSSLSIGSYGGFQHSSWRGPRIGPDYPGLFASYPNTENKSFILLKAKIPTPGWYLVEIQGQPGRAKLRHQYGGPIIQSWDKMQCDYWCNYTTIEYFDAGTHYLYFWSVANSMTIEKATVSSYQPPIKRLYP